jgi:FkbM family methyltransferase
MVRMTPQRRFIRLLDRPGGRGLLGWLATQYARRKTGLDVAVIHDGAWIRRAGRYFLAESETFDWDAVQMAGWQPDLRETLAMFRDWWFHEYRPQPGDVIVDVGAGNGEDALVFAAAGRVVCIEAHPATFRRLETTCRLNRLANVTCLHLALMDQPGTVKIETRSAYKGNTVGATGDATVPALPLDEVCRQQGITHIDFLKMNIEGAEQLAIRGMTRMIEHTRHVCIACHDFLASTNEFYRTKGIVTEFLRGHGFAVSDRPDHPDPWVRDHVYGRRV